MLNWNELQNKLEIKIAISDTMAKNINLWERLYKNIPPWKSDSVKTLNLPASISNELARLATIEFESQVEDVFLNEDYQIFIDNIRDYCEVGCAFGGIAFKPFASESGIIVDVAYADHFFPTAYDDRNNITGAIFIDQLTRGKSIYTKVEHHNLDGTKYTIKNYAFEKKGATTLDETLGNEVPLTSVLEWADIEPEGSFENIEKPLFCYFKMPGINKINRNSPLGVSCFHKAIEIIKQVDIQYSHVLWEYEGTQLAVEADGSMFMKSFDGKPMLPEGKERLYRTYNIAATDTGTKRLTVFSPEIRDDSLFNGLNNLIKRVEFLCGLSYGTISDPAAMEKTATEIIKSNQRLYSTVKDIQKSLQNTLESLVYAMSVWCTLSGRSINPNADLSFNWDDSIVISKEQEIESMRLDVSSNIIKPELYIAKKYGVTVKEALKMMPETDPLPKSPFDD